MDLGRTSKSVTEYVESSPFGDMFTNPLYVSLLITVGIMLIVVCIYTDGSVVKTGFYVFCLSTVIIFLHNRVLLLDHKKKLCSADEQNIVNAIGQPLMVSGGGDFSGLNYLNSI